ncbi:unnamed protein product, partial [Prorocentrum cordatum]
MRAGWQRLTIEKEGGGPIQSDDTVFLKANTQAYLDVAGSVVSARWTNTRDSQEFVIQGGGEDGAIRSGDRVYLVAHTGNCLEAKDMDVFAKSPEQGEAQAFAIELCAHAAPSDKTWVLQGDDGDEPSGASSTQDPFLRWAQMGVLSTPDKSLRAGAVRRFEVGGAIGGSPAGGRGPAALGA